MRFPLDRTVLTGRSSPDQTVDVVHVAFGGLGGHRTLVEGVASRQSEHGIKSAAVLVGSPAALAQTSRWRGVKYELRCPLRRRGDVRSMIQVGSTMRKLRPKVVVCHSHRHIPAAWVGQILAGRRPRVVLVEHQSVQLRSKVDDFWSLIGLIVADALVVLTPLYLEGYRWRRLVPRLVDRVEIIPNGVTLPENPFRRTRDQLKFTFGTACRLIASKSIESVIRCSPLLDGDVSSWRYRIAGDGPERGSLEQLVNSLGLEGVVQFDGALDGTAMDDWYATLDCYVQPSKGETMSMSLLEAAAHALPIITCDLPGIRDVFTDGDTARILPSSDPGVIAQSLSDLRFDGSGWAMGERARRLMEKQHDSAVMSMRYEIMFRDLGVTGEVR